MRIILALLAIGVCLVQSAASAGENTGATGAAVGASQDGKKGSEMNNDLFDEYAAIRKIMESYAESARQGKSEIVKPSFHADAVMYMYNQTEGKIVGGPIQKLFNSIDSRPASKDVEVEITSIQIHGTIANARVESRNWGGARFSDMFLLVKDGQDWKIMAKVYHRN